MFNLKKENDRKKTNLSFQSESSIALCIKIDSI